MSHQTRRKPPIDDFSKPGCEIYSNFFPSVVYYDKVAYDCIEKAFQAAKGLDLIVREQIRNAPTAGKAKRMGGPKGIVVMRPSWDDMKVAVMLDLIRQKFTLTNSLGMQLLESDDADIIEGNNWGDEYWGVCRGVGKNMLGKLIMERREELKLELVVTR